MLWRRDQQVSTYDLWSLARTGPEEPTSVVPGLHESYVDLYIIRTERQLQEKQACPSARGHWGVQDFQRGTSASQRLLVRRGKTGKTPRTRGKAVEDATVVPAAWASSDSSAV